MTVYSWNVKGGSSDVRAVNKFVVVVPGSHLTLIDDVFVVVGVGVCVAAAPDDGTVLVDPLLLLLIVVVVVVVEVVGSPE